MSDTRGGRWEFDENGNVHYVPPEGEIGGNSDQSRVDGAYRRSYRSDNRQDQSQNYNYHQNASRRKNNDDKGWHWIFIVLGFMVAWPSD